MKINSVILTIFLCALILILNNYVISLTTKGQWLTKEQLEAFRSAKTVRIVLEQSYQDDEDKEIKNVSIPFEDVIRNYLQFTKLKVVGADAESCDLEITIEAKGKALSGKYEDESYYTGASISGLIWFETSGVSIYSKSFSGTRRPSSSVKLFRPVEEAIKNLKNPSRAPFLEAFDESDYDRAIVEMIGEICGLNCIIAAMKDGDERIRKHTASVLKRKRDPQTVEPLIFALNHENWEVRKEAIKILGEIKDTRAVEPLMAALKEGNASVRRSAIVALGDIKDPKSVESLIAVLKNKDEDNDNREEVLRVLRYEIKDTRAVEPLIVVLKDKDEKNRIRAFAAEALGEIKDIRAIEPLIAALKEEDVSDTSYSYEPLRQRLAAEALMKITGVSMGSYSKNRNHKKWLSWWNKNKHKYLIKK